MTGKQRDKPAVSGPRLPLTGRHRMHARGRCGCSGQVVRSEPLRQELVRQSPDTVLLRRVRSWFDRSAQTFREESFFEQCLPATPGEPFSARLSLVTWGLRYTFLLDGTEPSAASGTILGSETSGGYIGAYIGLFASGNGQDLPAEAVFHHFDYR